MQFGWRFAFWSEHIFRITITRDGIYRDPYDRLPEDCRMLVGRPQPTEVEQIRLPDRLVLRTSELELTVSLEPFAIRTADAGGKTVFAQKRPDTPTADVLPVSLARLGEETAVFESLCLSPEEEIYGLGRRFDSVARARAGRLISGTRTPSEPPAPAPTASTSLFTSPPRRYGLFLNSSAPTDWQVGTADSSALGFSVLDHQMDYFVIQHPDPKEILRGYCSLTGFAKMPPVWGFGLWMSRNSYTTWDETERIGRELREHDIPCDLLHLDTAWFETDWNCDLRFSKERFPDPEGHLRRLREDGFRVSLWQYNFIPPRQDNQNYLEACQKGYFAKDATGAPYRNPETMTGSWVDDAIIDFTNPEARDWYGAQIRALMKLGASAIKTDFGEGIPSAARYHGIEGKYIHNFYPLPLQLHRLEGHQGGDWKRYRLGARRHGWEPALPAPLGRGQPVHL